MKAHANARNDDNLEILADNLKLLASQYSVMGSKSDFMNERLEWFAKGLEEEIQQRKMGIYPDFGPSKTDEEDAAKAA